MCHVWAAVKQNRSPSTSITLASWGKTSRWKETDESFLGDKWAQACLDSLTVCHPWSMFTLSPVAIAHRPLSLSFSLCVFLPLSLTSLPRAGHGTTCQWWGRNTGSNDSSPMDFAHYCRPGGPVVKRREWERESKRMEVRERKRERERPLDCLPQETSQLIMQITQWLFNICGRSTCRVVIANLQQRIRCGNGGHHSPQLCRVHQLRCRHKKKSLNLLLMRYFCIKESPPRFILTDFC